MATRITQVEATRLKVEGSLCLEEAELLEQICRDLERHSIHEITIDLADLSFLDSDSAEILCRLKRERGVRLEGLYLFVQKVIELAAKSDYASE